MSVSIELVTKFAPYTDELFSAESRISLLTNKDFDFNGASVVKIYKIGNSAMNDYDRRGENVGSSGLWSRYGAVENVSATTQTCVLKRDRSFTFTIDKMDEDETVMQMSASNAVARQTRDVVVPEVDSYTYGVMCANAGTKPAATALTADTIYEQILLGNEALDNAMVPETQRVLVVTPAVYRLMKQCPDITMETDIGNDLRLKGVIGMLDGCTVVKVPTNRLPEKFGFMIAHPSATCAPVKLQDCNIHANPPGISGYLVEGRFVYDAFVLDNKAKGIYYQAVT